jgi:hypothetical protein
MSPAQACARILVRGFFNFLLPFSAPELLPGLPAYFILLPSSFFRPGLSHTPLIPLTGGSGVMRKSTFNPAEPGAPGLRAKAPLIPFYGQACTIPFSLLRPVLNQRFDDKGDRPVYPMYKGKSIRKKEKVSGIKEASHYEENIF